MDSYPGDDIFHAGGSHPSTRATVKDVSVMVGGAVEAPAAAPITQHATPATVAVYAESVKFRLRGERMPHPFAAAPGCRCAYCHWEPPPTHPVLFLMHHVLDDGTLVADGHTMLCRFSCYRRYLMECLRLDICQRQAMLQVLQSYRAAAEVHGGAPLGMPRESLACFNPLTGDGMTHAEWHAVADAQEARLQARLMGDRVPLDASIDCVWKTTGVPWTTAAAIIEGHMAHLPQAAAEAVEAVKAATGAGVGDAAAGQAAAFTTVGLRRPAEEDIVARIAAQDGTARMPAEFEAFVAEQKAKEAAQQAKAAGRKATGAAVARPEQAGRGDESEGGGEKEPAPRASATALSRMVRQRPSASAK